MVQRFLFIFFIVFSGLIATEEKPVIIVSVAPYKFLVNELSNGAAEVFLIVPAGTSAHTFEPSPKDMIKAAKARLWFTLGETFEKKAVAAISAGNLHFRTIDLTQGVSLIQSEGCHCEAHHHGGPDLHIWLSPLELKAQVRTIGEGLTRLFPESKEAILERVKNLEAKLDQLNEEIKKVIENSDLKTILVSHPAFGYFCRDYQCKQISIEVEGKDPTPKKLLALMNLAKEEKIKKVYAEPQYSDKGAQLVAKEIGAKVVIIDPYHENLFENLISIAREFAN